MAYRVIYEYLNTLSRLQGKIPKRKLRTGVIIWYLGGGLVLLWLKKLYPHLELIEIVTPAAIVSGVLSCGVYCLVNPWMDKCFLPAPLRMSKVLVVMNIVAGIIFTAIGLKAFWDYGRYPGYLALGVAILLCLFLARCLRFLHQKQNT